ncbi:MAG: flagellin [Burkholderiales bacterium]
MTLELYGANRSPGPITAGGVTATNLNPIVRAINAQTAATGITASVAAEAITLANTTGEDIGIANFTASTAGTQRFTLSGASGHHRYVHDLSSRDSSRVGGPVSFSSNEAFTITSSRYGSLLSAALSGQPKTLDTVEIATRDGVRAVINSVDGALSTIADQRGSVGALMTRVSATIQRGQVAGDNLEAARGRLTDVDFAAEIMLLARTQVIAQAGAAALAQANAVPNQVLQPLRT